MYKVPCMEFGIMGGNMADEGTTKKFSFGGCHYERTSPPLSDLSPSTKVLNVELSLDEALKLNLALDECIRKINRYKESAESGKRALVNVAVHLHVERISVNESKLPKGLKKKSIQG